MKIRTWQDMGERLKKGYLAKFEYLNPAFVEEVDRHIKDVKVGNNKQASRDWLKRMAHLAGVRFEEPIFLFPVKEKPPIINITIINQEPERREFGLSELFGKHRHD